MLISGLVLGSCCSIFQVLGDMVFIFAHGCHKMDSQD